MPSTSDISSSVCRSDFSRIASIPASSKIASEPSSAAAESSGIVLTWKAPACGAPSQSCTMSNWRSLR
jgi:hypothetical protein